MVKVCLKAKDQQRLYILDPEVRAWDALQSDLHCVFVTPTQVSRIHLEEAGLSCFKSSSPLLLTRMGQGPLRLSVFVSARRLLSCQRAQLGGQR